MRAVVGLRRPGIQPLHGPAPLDRDHRPDHRARPAVRGARVRRLGGARGPGRDLRRPRAGGGPRSHDHPARAARRAPRHRDDHHPDRRRGGALAHAQAGRADDRPGGRPVRRDLRPVHPARDRGHAGVAQRADPRARAPDDRRHLHRGHRRRLGAGLRRRAQRLQRRLRAGRRRRAHRLRRRAPARPHAAAARAGAEPLPQRNLPALPAHPRPPRPLAPRPAASRRDHLRDDLRRPAAARRPLRPRARADRGGHGVGPGGGAADRRGAGGARRGVAVPDARRLGAAALPRRQQLENYLIVPRVMAPPPASIR